MATTHDSRAQFIKFALKHPAVLCAYLRHGCRLAAAGKAGRFMLLAPDGRLAGVFRWQWLADAAGSRRFGRGQWYVFKIVPSHLAAWTKMFARFGRSIEALTPAIILHFAEQGEAYHADET